MSLYEYQEEALRLLQTDKKFQRRIHELRYLLGQETWNDADVWKRCMTLVAAMHVQTRGGDHEAKR